jgi:hypothetical protein
MHTPSANTELRVGRTRYVNIKGQQQQRVCQIRKLKQHRTQEMAGQERLMFRFCTPSLAYLLSIRHQGALEMKKEQTRRTYLSIPTYRPLMGAFDDCFCGVFEPLMQRNGKKTQLKKSNI